MEYAIGKFIYIDTNARIQVLFYTKKGYWYRTSTIAIFPPTGKIFAPSFAIDYPGIKNSDIVLFNYEENALPNSGVDKDFYIIPRKKDGGEVRKCAQIFPVPSMETIYQREKLSDAKELCFFLIKEKSASYICGPIWSSDSSPRIGKEVKAWTFRAGYDTICDPETNRIYLTADLDDFIKREPDHWVDCMTPVQLHDWFLKDKLTKLLDKEQLSLLQEKMKQIEKTTENDDLQQVRFTRIRSLLKTMTLTWTELSTLKDIPGMQDFFDHAVQENLDELCLQKKNQIEARKQELNEEERKISDEMAKLKKKLDMEKKDLSDKLSLQEKALEQKKNEIEVQKKSLALIKSQKETLIESIRIQSGLITPLRTGETASFSKGYPLEIIKRTAEAQIVTRKLRDEYCRRVNESLQLSTGFMRPRELMKLDDSAHFCLKTNDIRTGVFLANVLGNTIYQLCQPSPKWITFNDFWTDSLAVIWESAHAQPDVWHFLLIENFNLALPECWGNPLWNIEAGKITLLPLAGKPRVPGNLRIIVTEAATESDDNTHFGLVTKVHLKWPSLNINGCWDDNNGETLWEKFADDRNDGLAVNEEYYYPVGS